jgi:hypothetical protein
MNTIYKLLFCTIGVLKADSNISPLLNAQNAPISKYNILSLESSMYKAYMQSKFLEYIEMRSYTIANRQPIGGKTIKARESKKIAIPELFDMIAGSETGAILATYLSIANDDATKK